MGKPREAWAQRRIWGRGSSTEMQRDQLGKEGGGSCLQRTAGVEVQTVWGLRCKELGDGAAGLVRRWGGWQDTSGPCTGLLWRTGGGTGLPVEPDGGPRTLCFSALPPPVGAGFPNRSQLGAGVSSSPRKVGDRMAP